MSRRIILWFVAFGCGPACARAPVVRHVVIVDAGGGVTADQVGVVHGLYLAAHARAEEPVCIGVPGAVPTECGPASGAQTLPPLGAPPPATDLCTATAPVWKASGGSGQGDATIVVVYAGSGAAQASACAAWAEAASAAIRSRATGLVWVQVNGAVPEPIRKLGAASPGRVHVHGLAELLARQEWRQGWRLGAPAWGEATSGALSPGGTTRRPFSALVRSVGWRPLGIRAFATPEKRAGLHATIRIEGISGGWWWPVEPREHLAGALEVSLGPEALEEARPATIAVTPTIAVTGLDPAEPVPALPRIELPTGPVPLRIKRARRQGREPAIAALEEPTTFGVCTVSAGEDACALLAHHTLELQMPRRRVKDATLEALAGGAKLVTSCQGGVLSAAVTLPAVELAPDVPPLVAWMELRESKPTGWLDLRRCRRRIPPIQRAAVDGADDWGAWPYVIGAGLLLLGGVAVLRLRRGSRA